MSRRSFLRTLCAAVVASAVSMRMIEQEEFEYVCGIDMGFTFPSVFIWHEGVIKR